LRRFVSRSWRDAEEFVADGGQVEGEAGAFGDDDGDFGEREVIVEVGPEGVLDGVVEGCAEGAAAGGVGVFCGQRVERLAQDLAPGVVGGGGAGLLAVGDAVLDVDDLGDGAGGAGQSEGGFGGLVGVGLGLGDAMGGVAGGEHVEFAEFAQEGELAGAAVGAGFLGARLGGREVGRSPGQGDGVWHGVLGTFSFGGMQGGICDRVLAPDRRRGSAADERLRRRAAAQPSKPTLSIERLIGSGTAVLGMIWEPRRFGP